MSNNAGGAVLLSTRLRKEHPLATQLGEETLVLLTQRGYGAKRFPGAWTLPTGVAHTDESTTLTAAREVWEELMINFTPELKPVHSGQMDKFQIWNSRHFRNLRAILWRIMASRVAGALLDSFSLFS